MKNCIFCKIAKGKHKSAIIYQNNGFIAFLDAYPVSEGHTLVISRRHYRWVYDVPNFKEYWQFVLQITKMIQKNLNPQWIQYFTHGKLPHAHIHIIPRYEPIERASFMPFENNQNPASFKDLQNIARLINNNI